jgi:hypothetical protein
MSKPFTFKISLYSYAVIITLSMPSPTIYPKHPCLTLPFIHVEGTHAGIPGTHSEPFRARFIGVKNNDTFFVRPIIGSQRGRPPEVPKSAVTPIKAFGLCIMNGPRKTRRSKRYDDKLAKQQELYHTCPLPRICQSLQFSFYSCFG